MCLTAAGTTDPETQIGLASNLAVTLTAGLQVSTEMALGHLAIKQPQETIHIPTTVHKQLVSHVLKEPLKRSPQAERPLPNKTKTGWIDSP